MTKRCPLGKIRKGNKCIKKKEEPNWYASSDGFYTSYKGFDARVYRVNERYGGKMRGYEYELSRDNPPAEYDSLTESSMGGDHAETAEEAMAWAERTIEEWDD